MPLSHPERIHPALWLASQLALGGVHRLPTGHRTLDQALGGGWPTGTLIELLPAQPGIGEIRLVFPALARLADTHRRIVFLNPPYPPSLQCAAAWNLPVDRMLWIRTHSPQDTAWAAAQVLRHSSSAALLCWAESLPYADLLRLHRLVRRNTAFTLLYRPPHLARHDSPAGLRAALQPCPQGLKLHFFSHSSGRPRVESLVLPWHDPDLDQSHSSVAAAGLSGAATTPDALHTATGVT